MCSIVEFNFLNFIKDNKVVKNYRVYTQNIRSNIINQDDAIKIKKLGHAGLFLLLFFVGEGAINIIYYL